MKMVVYVKTGDKSVGVVYKVNNSQAPSTKLCGTPYEGVALSDRVPLFFMD